MVLSRLSGRRKEIGQHDIDKFIRDIDSLGRDADGLVIAANYRGGVPYLEIIGPELQTPYESCEFQITQEGPKVVRPLWDDYQRLASRFNHPYHLMLDDHISPAAFGSRVYQTWLKQHRVPEDRIKIAGIVDDSGTADIYIVRGTFLPVKRRDRAKIPEKVDESRINELFYLVR